MSRKVRNFLYFSHSEEKFNLTVDFCTNIENNTEDPAYAAVEKEVQQYNIVDQLFKMFNNYSRL